MIEYINLLFYYIHDPTSFFISLKFWGGKEKGERERKIKRSRRSPWKPVMTEPTHPLKSLWWHYQDWYHPSSRKCSPDPMTQRPEREDGYTEFTVGREREREWEREVYTISVLRTLLLIVKLWHCKVVSFAKWLKMVLEGCTMYSFIHLKYVIQW